MKTKKKVEQYLLQTPEGYYFIWYRDENGKPSLNGPHSEKMINLPVIKVQNPLSFEPINKISI